MKSSDLRQEREIRRRKDYREVILRAAHRVLLRKGFSALTMDDVAREAQLSKATIYKYAPGKGALLSEIIGQGFDDLAGRVAAIVAAPAPAAEKLARVVDVVLRNGEEMKSLNRVLWMDKAMLKLMRLFASPPGKAGAAPDADRKMIAMLRRKRLALVDLGERILAEGVESGEFRPMDTAAAADFVESVLQGYMHMRFWRSASPLSAGAAGKLAQFIVEGIRNPDPSGKEL